MLDPSVQNDNDNVCLAVDRWMNRVPHTDCFNIMSHLILLKIFVKDIMFKVNPSINVFRRMYDDVHSSRI